MAEMVPVTRREIRQIKRELRKKQPLVCLDAVAYVKTLLIAQGMVQQGEMVMANIKKGY
jgi:hypothetical protein